MSLWLYFMFEVFVATECVEMMKEMASNTLRMLGSR